jgi:hypothetical protein
MLLTGYLDMRLAVNKYTENAAFLDMAPCGSCKNDASEERIASIIRAIGSPETSVLTGVTGCHTPEDGILHSHRSEKPQILHSINWMDSVAET